MIPNEKKRKLTLGCSRRKLYPLLRGINKLTSHKKQEKIKIFAEIKCHQKKIIYQNLISISIQIKCHTLFTLH